MIQVLDVTSLQRGLYLTLELMALGRPLVLALNMTEALAKSGGMLDVQRLQARLGVPCISINARTGRGARQLMAAAMQAAKAGKAPASPVPFPLESLPAAEHRKLAQARYAWIDRCLAVCLTLPRQSPRACRRWIGCFQIVCLPGPSWPRWCWPYCSLPLAARSNANTPF